MRKDFNYLYNLSLNKTCWEMQVYFDGLVQDYIISSVKQWR